MSDVEIRRIREAADFAICCAIRVTVFVQEQGVAMEEELDELDEIATHFLVTVGGRPAATARLLTTGDMAKIGRVAVLSAHRGKGIGRALMQYVESSLASVPEISRIALSAQTQAVPFYESCGYVKEGEEYMEAGIPHFAMSKPALRRLH